MKLNKTTPFALLAMMSLLAPYAGANTFNGVVSEEVNSFEDEGNNSEYYSQAEVRVPAPLSNSVFTFSGPGEDVVSVTWSAPAGKLIEIATPAGFDDIEVDFRLFSGGLYRAGGITPDTQVQFADFQGPALPSFTDNTLFSGPGPDGDGARVLFDYTLPAGETYRFSSVTATVTIPESYTMDFNSPTNQFGILGEAETSGLETVVLEDPGQWIRLVDVPEPNSLALLGLGGLIVARRRHHS